MRLSTVYVLLVLLSVIIIMVAATFYKPVPIYQTKCIKGYSFIVDQRGAQQIIDMSGNGLPCIEEEK